MDSNSFYGTAITFYSFYNYCVVIKPFNTPTKVLTFLYFIVVQHKFTEDEARTCDSDWQNTTLCATIEISESTINCICSYNMISHNTNYVFTV